MQRFESVIGAIAWDATVEQLIIEMAGRTHQLAWQEIRGAGVVMLPRGSAPDAPIGRHLVIAPAAEEYLLRVPLPNAYAEDAAVATALEEALHSKLGERYHLDLTQDTYRKVLIPPWSNLPHWVMPVAVLAFIGVSAIFLTLCLLVTMMRSGAWEFIWWQVGLGLVAWLVLVGGILSVYRKIWMK